MRKFTAAFAFAALFAVLANAAETTTKLVLFKAGTTAQQRQSQIQALGGRLIADYEFVNESLADFSNKAVGDVRAMLPSRAPNATGVENNETLNWLNAVYAPLPAAAQVVGQARRNIDEGAVSTPAFSEAKSVDASAQMPWGIARVNAKSAWARGLDGSGVKVGIVDTGIDLSHPDLAGNIAASYNAVNHDISANDDHGHGTHVAGIIAGMGAGEDGVFGVAPKARIYAAKGLDAKGSGSVNNIVDAINWTIGQKVKVINMSLGAPRSLAAVDQAVKSAHDAGIAVICAAGNNGQAVNYPAASPGATAIAASDSSDNIASFSSRGPQIVFIAPGKAIYSSFKGGQYKTMSGTSMAAPHAAGLAALAVQAGAADGDAAVEIMKSAASKLPNLSQDEQGTGLVDAGKISKK
ncbi:MAG: S8 family serine peptidase [Elusimicrobiales bacterium]